MYPWLLRLAYNRHAHDVTLAIETCIQQTCTCPTPGSWDLHQACTWLTPGMCDKSTLFVSKPINSCTMAWYVHCSSRGVTGSSLRSRISTKGEASCPLDPKSNRPRSSTVVRWCSDWASFSQASLFRWYLHIITGKCMWWCHQQTRGRHEKSMPSCFLMGAPVSQDSPEWFDVMQYSLEVQFDCIWSMHWTRMQRFLS